MWIVKLSNDGFLPRNYQIRPLGTSYCFHSVNLSLFGQENVMCSKISSASGAKNPNCSYGIGERDGRNVWSMVTEEAGALIHLDKNVSSFSSSSTSAKADKFCRGVLSFSKSYLPLIHYQSVLNVPSNISIFLQLVHVPIVRRK